MEPTSSPLVCADVCLSASMSMHVCDVCTSQTVVDSMHVGVREIRPVVTKATRRASIDRLVLGDSVCAKEGAKCAWGGWGKVGEGEGEADSLEIVASDSYSSDSEGEENEAEQSRRREREPCSSGWEGMGGGEEQGESGAKGFRYARELQDGWLAVGCLDNAEAKAVVDLVSECCRHVSPCTAWVSDGNCSPAEGLLLRRHDGMNSLAYMSGMCSDVAFEGKRPCKAADHVRRLEALACCLERMCSHPSSEVGMAAVAGVQTFAQIPLLLASEQCPRLATACLGRMLHDRGHRQHRVRALAAISACILRDQVHLLSSP